MLSPTLTVLGVGSTYSQRFREMAAKGNFQGGIIHDVRVASPCLDAGVSSLWSVDRDFSRIASLKTKNPLVRLSKD